MRKKTQFNGRIIFFFQLILWQLVSHWHQFWIPNYNKILNAAGEVLYYSVENIRVTLMVYANDVFMYFIIIFYYYIYFVNSTYSPKALWEMRYTLHLVTCSAADTRVDHYWVCQFYCSYSGNCVINTFGCLMKDFATAITYK